MTLTSEKKDKQRQRGTTSDQQLNIEEAKYLGVITDVAASSWPCLSGARPAQHHTGADKLLLAL